MSRNYYFLVAGLSDLVLDDGKSGGSFNDFMDEISELVDPSDQKLLQCIRLPFDNKNLVTLLQNLNREFDTRGNFSKEGLIAATKYPDELPLYMQAFLEAQKENRQLFSPGIIAEDELSWLFYDEMSEHSNIFLREWFIFERSLRNVITGVNYRKGIAHISSLATERESALSSVIIGNDEVAEAVLRSNAADFGLTGTLPWIEKLIQNSGTGMQDFEYEIDLLRWDILNEMTTFSYFSIETILAFSLKLLMVERWRILDPEKGKEKLNRFVEELKAGFAIPAGF